MASGYAFLLFPILVFVALVREVFHSFHLTIIMCER
jgi:hypothetical protein